jgi:dienelactone hydrolase
MAGWADWEVISYSGTASPIPMLPAPKYRRMAGWADWEVISYSGTKHSFTNLDAASAGIPVALAYNKQTDQRSWKAIVNFFEEIFA